jgi:hypothetical protein
MKRRMFFAGVAALSLFAFGCGSDSADTPPVETPVDPQSVDQTKVTLEVVTFDLAPGTDEATVRADDLKVEEFIQRQPGFLRRVTGFGRHEALGPEDMEKRQFFLTVFWETLEEANAAAVALMNSPLGMTQRPGLTLEHYGHYVIGDSVAAGGYKIPLDAILGGAGQAIELVSWEVADGVSAADVVTQDVTMDKAFLRSQPGYVARIGAMGKNELTQSTAHLAFVYWESIDDAMNAATALFQAQSMMNPPPKDYKKPNTPFVYSHFFDKLTVAK